MICPICKVENLVKMGFSSSGRQRYKCKTCGSIRTGLLQMAQDKKRIAVSDEREHTRIDNALLEYNQAILKLLKDRHVTKFVTSHEKIAHPKMCPIIQISDAHFNELVKLDHNKYDFEIASKRFQKFAHKCLKYLKPFDISEVVVAMTGDLMNSDRRLDELLAMATNRTNATFLAVDILTGFLLDLNKHYNVSVCCISGNESRIPELPGYIDLIATDNYDFTIFNILDRTLSGKKGITFLKGNPVEQVLNIAGQNVLVTHGSDYPANGIENKIQSVKGKFVSQGIKVDYIIFGHLHATGIGDSYARSASVVGANAYSDRKLNLAGRASQLLHFLFADGSRDCMKIDLQDTENYAGYPLDASVDCYNAKSELLLKRKQTVIDI